MAKSRFLIHKKLSWLLDLVQIDVLILWFHFDPNRKWFYSPMRVIIPCLFGQLHSDLTRMRNQGRSNRASQANAWPPAFQKLAISQSNLCTINILMKLIFYIAALAPLWNSCNLDQQLGKTFTSSCRQSVTRDLHLVAKS